MMLKKEKRDGWFSATTYQHFDLPWTFEQARSFVVDDRNIEKHGFLPFLAFSIVYRRIDGTIKEREIKIAGNRDSSIYSYFAKVINEKYEETLKANGLSNCVTAYRANLGNNITFAKEVFDEIEKRGGCTVLCQDIKGFFDNLDHKILKDQWQELNGTQRLNAAEYAVFRSITKFAWVDRKSCFLRLGYNQKQRKRRPICSNDEFRNLVKGRDGRHQSLVNINRNSYGIPQGTAISACLANVYMLPFDKRIQEECNKVGGLYRRYSDDILCIFPPRYETQIHSLLKQQIGYLKLEFQSKKTTITHFERCTDNTLALRVGEKPLQYLGFTFDGQSRLLRAQTLSRYWAKAIKAINTANKDCLKAGRKGRQNKVFRRQLYSRYTHLGKLNFISYVKKCARILNGGPYKKTKLWKQIKNHFAKIDRRIH